MSKYIQSVQSIRPEHFYVFDLSRADLDTGTVEDQGHVAVDLTVDEDTGFAEVEVRPAIVDGLSNSVYPAVNHEVGGAATEYAARFSANIAADYFGPDSRSNWTIESVFKPSRTNKAGTSGHLFSFNQTGIDGLALDYDFSDPTNPVFQFVFTQDYTEAADLEIFRSGDFETDTVYHIGLVKSGNTYSLYVDGVSVATGEVDGDYTPTALNSPTLCIGGWDAEYHSDSTIQSVAFIDRVCGSDELKERYENIGKLSEYGLAVESFGPRVNYIITPDGSVGQVEPSVDSISTGVDPAELYEDESQALSLQPTTLAPSVSAVKLLHFDLSGLDSGVSTFLDIDTTTDANSSVLVEYSFDNVDYTVFPEGQDTIEELDANWGGVV